MSDAPAHPRDQKSRCLKFLFLAWLVGSGGAAAWSWAGTRLPADLEGVERAHRLTPDERVRDALGNKYPLFAYLSEHVPAGGTILAQLPGTEAARGGFGALLIGFQHLLFPRKLRFFLAPSDLVTGDPVDTERCWYLQFHDADAVVQPERWELVDHSPPFRVWRVTSPIR